MYLCSPGAPRAQGTLLGITCSYQPQFHILSKICDIKSHIKYEHLFGNVNEQKEVAQLFIQLLAVREDLTIQQQEDEQDQELQAYQRPLLLLDPVPCTLGI